MSYALLATPAANRQLEKLPPKVADGIRGVLQRLADDPADPRFDIRPIQGHSRHPPTLRLRIASYRVLLKIDHDGKRIVVLRVGPRHAVYRGMDHLDDAVE